MLEFLLSVSALLMVSMAIFQKRSLLEENKELKLTNDRLASSIDALLEESEADSNAIIKAINQDNDALRSRNEMLIGTINSDRELIIQLEDDLTAAKKQEVEDSKQLEDDIKKDLKELAKKDKDYKKALAKSTKLQKKPLKLKLKK